MKTDPRKPRRRPSAFRYFLKDFKKASKKKNHKVLIVWTKFIRSHFHSSVKARNDARDNWLTLSESEKAPYYAKASKPRISYLEACSSEHFMCSIKSYAPPVWNQSPEPICLPIGMADMLTILYRMEGLHGLLLSPQPLVDSYCRSFLDCRDMLINPYYGLQSIEDYPFTKTPKNPEKSKYSPTGMSYKSGHRRFIIDDLIIKQTPAEIKDLIVTNFSKSGKRYPVAVIIEDMGRFAEWRVAHDSYDLPYHSDLHIENIFKDPDSHLLLVVGIDTRASDESEHSCLVRNSWGVGWGRKGYGKIRFGMLKDAALPVFKTKKRSKKQKKNIEVQRSAFVRIMEAYKQISDDKSVRFKSSLLPFLGLEVPLELDPWEFLRSRIHQDYNYYEGIGSMVRVLLILFEEVKADHEYFPSTTQTSAYELFLLHGVETITDLIPCTFGLTEDLTDLLSRVPYIPKSVVKKLVCMCDPAVYSDKERELNVCESLTIVCNLLQNRQRTEAKLLKVLLQSLWKRNQVQIH